MDTKFTMKGLKATLKLMESLPPRVNTNATKRAMRKAIRPMRAAARAAAPKDQGALKRAIKSKVDVDREGRTTGIVGIDSKVRGRDGRRPVRYAHLADRTPTQKGGRYMVRAFEETGQESRRILTDELRREIAKEATSN